MKQRPTLYMMLGYPGSGKTTVAEILSEITAAVHLNSDNVRLRAFNPPQFNPAEHSGLYDTLDYLTELILKSGTNVIYDANLNKYKFRQQKYDICAKVGANAQLIWIKSDPAVAKQRATVEADKNPAHRPFGNMDTAMFDRLVSEIEEPKENEKPIIINAHEISKDKIGETLKQIIKPA